MQHVASPDDRAFAHYRSTGDAEALATVFDRTAPKLLLLASHWTRDPAAAEDLVQVTFVQALRDAAQWDERQPLLGWLTGILAHRALDLKKCADRRAHTDLDAVELPGREPSPLDAAMDGEVLERVTAAVDGLQEPYRSVLVLRLVHGLEPFAIAHALGRPPATVRKQLERGLQQLRAALPASIALLLAGLLATGRGLASVRTAVMTARRLPVAASTLVTAGGVLVMNKMLLAVVGLVLGLTVVWLWSTRSPSQVPTISVVPGQPAPVAASLDVPPEPPAAERALDRTVGTATPASAAIEVAVLDSQTDAPLAGIGIELVPRNGRDERLTSRRAATDAQGLALFGSLAPGPHHVHADVAGKDGDADADIDASAGPPQRITFRLRAGVLVHGTVLDAEGHPVAGASVLRYPPNGMARDPHPAEAATTDATGAFELRALQGRLTLQAVDATHAPSPLLSRLPDAQGQPIILQLGAEPARLHGIVSCGGEPVVAALVTLDRDRPKESRNGDALTQSHADSHARTAADGSFAFAPTLAGAATVRVVAGGAAPAAVDVVLRAGERRDMAIDLQPAARLCGRIVDQDGAPIGGAIARCGAASTHTPADGTFEFDNLPPAAATLIASAAGYCSRQLQLELAIGQAPQCELSLERLPLLAGRVIDVSGRALPGLIVTAIRKDLGRGRYRPMTDAQGRLDDTYGRHATAAADGTFTLPLMPGIAYLLDVSEKGQWLSIDGERFGEFTAPRTDVVLTIQPEDLATACVQGRIVDAANAPVGRVWFQISDGTRLGTVAVNTPGTRYSDAEGRFSIGPIPAHAYRLKVHPPGSQLPEFDTPQFQLQPGQTLDLGDVTAGGSAMLAVQLRREGGGVFAAAMLQLDGDDKRQLVFPFDAAGHLEQRIAPGRYQLTIYGDDVATRTAPLLLTNGERAQLQFTLATGVRFSLRLSLPAGETAGAIELRAADGSLEWQDDLDASDKLQAPPFTLSPCLSPGAHTAAMTCRSGKRYTASFAVFEQPHEPGKPPAPCELLWQPAN